MARTSHPSTQMQPMPGNVRGALAKKKLTEAFEARPDYQRNDYLKWIALANGAAAKQQRIDQMLAELESGNAFKGEPWTAPEPVKPAVRAAKSDE